MTSSPATEAAAEVITAADREIGPQAMYESLNGFDEIAVAKAFGAVITAFAETDPMKFGRALMFVDLRRQGFKDTDAYKRAMNSTNAETNEYFADDPEDVDPADPDSDAGKDN